MFTSYIEKKKNANREGFYLTITIKEEIYFVISLLSVLNLLVFCGFVVKIHGFKF